MAAHQGAQSRPRRVVKSARDTGQRMPGNGHCRRLTAGDNAHTGQNIGGKVGNQVPKSVGVDNLPGHRPALRTRRRQGQRNQRIGRRPQVGGRRAQRQMRRNRREYIASVKGKAYGMAPVIGVGQPPHPAALGRRQRHGRIPVSISNPKVPESGIVLPAHQGKQPVVGGQKAGVGRLQQDGGARRAYAGIDHGRKNAVGREIAESVSQRRRPVPDVLGANAVRKVNHAGGGVNAGDNAAHHAHIGVGQAEIRRQDNNGRSHNRKSAAMSAPPAMRRRAERVKEAGATAPVRPRRPAPTRR